jgi:hypothetical protein
LASFLAKALLRATFRVVGAERTGIQAGGIAVGVIAVDQVVAVVVDAV